MAVFIIAGDAMCVAMVMVVDFAHVMACIAAAFVSIRGGVIAVDGIINRLVAVPADQSAGMAAGFPPSKSILLRSHNKSIIAGKPNKNVTK